VVAIVPAAKPLFKAKMLSRRKFSEAGFVLERALFPKPGAFRGRNFRGFAQQREGDAVAFPPYALQHRNGFAYEAPHFCVTLL
jgi:hypothetical protein